MAKVLIVDDHASMRDSLRNTLENTGGFTVVGEVRTAMALDAVCSVFKPDLVFLDVCTEGGASGLEAAKKLRSTFPEIRIIVMSGFDEVTYAARAKELGAHAFVEKDNRLSYFAEVAQGVMEGRSFWPEPKTIPVPQGELPLTDRELEVLRLLCRSDMSVADIARELCISESTVAFHRQNILKKTGFKRTVDVVTFALGKGYINPNY